MKKTTSIISGIILLFSSSSAMAVQNINNSKKSTDISNKEYLQQVYNKNEYIIDQLETLARSLKAMPHRMGGHLTKVDMTLLLVKFNSVNFLMQKEIATDDSASTRLFHEDLAFNDLDIVKQSNVLLTKLPALYARYNMSPPVAFNEASTSSWFGSLVTTESLYKQLIRIESLLSGFRNTIEPENVYEVVMSTRTLLLGMCDSPNNVKNIPLVMGKRPKDVYSRLFNFIDTLPSDRNFIIPTKGSVHVMPSDVFDIAIIAMTYSKALQDERSNSLEKSALGSAIGIKKKAIYIMPEVVTPSHVYQAVAQNIEILECTKNAG